MWYGDCHIDVQDIKGDGMLRSMTSEMILYDMTDGDMLWGRTSKVMLLCDVVRYDWRSCWV